MRAALQLVVFACAASVFPHSSFAAGHPTLNLMVENDSVFNGTDEHYTNGLYISWTGPSDLACSECRFVAKWLMLPTEDPSPDYRYGFFVGQSMFTPANLPSASRRDRPFAGWLYVGARTYRETKDVLDRAQISLGVVGPASGADAIQRWWHSLKIFGGQQPDGWHSQIKDEPGFILTGQRTWRLSLINSGLIRSDLLPEINASAGNVFTYAGAGFTLRIGAKLNADWGPPRIEPALTGSEFIKYDKFDGVAWYAFAGAEERFVLHNITLDGNSFQHSANIAKELAVADFNAGFAVLWRYASARLSYTRRSHEFKLQREDDEFVSFNIAIGL
jgi:hypothetical protein